MIIIGNFHQPLIDDFLCDPEFKVSIINNPVTYTFLLLEPGTYLIIPITYRIWLTTYCISLLTYYLVSQKRRRQMLQATGGKEPTETHVAIT